MVAAIVNRIRLLLAVPLLMLIYLVLSGHFLPLLVKLERWFWLGFSGFASLVLVDAFLFQAFIWIGPRISMPMMSLAPVFATILARFFLIINLTGMADYRYSTDNRWETIGYTFHTWRSFLTDYNSTGGSWYNKHTYGTSSVILLPISRLFFKEQFGWGAIAGKMVSMLGVGLLSRV